MLLTMRGMGFVSYCVALIKSQNCSVAGSFPETENKDRSVEGGEEIIQQ